MEGRNGSTLERKTLMKNPMKLNTVKALDKYIIKKFLGTFFYALLLIISICVIFDVSEKIDDFMEKQAPFKAIIFDYYLNFIPYFANLFSGLFTFIAVIFFTSKMAFNSEIIAILSSGVSFKRFLLPYMMSAFVIFLLSFSLGNYIIPPANKRMQQFGVEYLKKKAINKEINIHRQIEPNIYIYIENYDEYNDLGREFSIEKFEDHKLVSKLSADILRWNREREVWEITNYVIRDIDGEKETLTYGAKKDTTLSILPEEFKTKKGDIETMTRKELLAFIDQQRSRGVDSLEEYEIERHRRTAVPFSSFVLTLIGASLASRKVRGGIGLHLGLGIGLSFAYIMFQQISKVFAISGSLSPFWAMWLPNVLFAGIGYLLYKWAAR